MDTLHHMVLPSLSVVIPAFNEEDAIATTLRNLFNQIDDIDEIVVVDNNSTDRTRDVVTALQADQPKLRLISEQRPGVYFARQAGYDAATSQVVARLDADTFARSGWARAVRAYFAGADAGVGAATGPLAPYDSPIRGLFLKESERIRARTLAESPDALAVEGIKMAPGGNMAMTKAAWTAVRDSLSDHPDIYDDLDLSLRVLEQGLSISYILDMQADTSARRFRTNPVSYWKYSGLLPKTYRLHGMKSAARTSHLEVWNNRLLHLVTWLPTRAYNPTTGGYSVKQIFAAEQDRIGGRTAAQVTHQGEA